MKTFLFAILMTMAPVLAHASALDEGSTWKSDYVPDTKRYTLEVSANNAVTLSIDPNSCMLDKLGDVTPACSRMRVLTIETVLEVTPVAADRRTMVYRLKGTDYGLVTRLGSLNGSQYDIKILKYDKNGDVIDARRLLQH